MILGFDIDGVVCDMEIPILRIIDFFPNKKGRDSIEHYYYAYRKPELNTALFSNHPGDKVILITSRNNKLADITKAWLKSNMIKYDELIMLNHTLPHGLIGASLNDWFMQQAEMKAKIIKEKNIEVYFEDTPDTVKALRELCPNVKIIQYGLRDLKLQ